MEEKGDLDKKRGKEEELAELLASEKRRSEEYLTRLKYLQADFDNYRKRMDKEIQDAEDSSAREAATKLLSVLDELELAMEHTKTAARGSAMQEGVRMVYRKLDGALESMGLKKIECIGKPFDPAFQEAVEKVQGKGVEDIVVEEIRSGFTFRGQVLRPSMVKVELAAKTAGSEEAKASE